MGFELMTTSRQIVWDDLDKKKYYFWGCTVFLGIRVFVYPTNLIKTRLQVQRGTDVYRGSWDAFLKVRVLLSVESVIFVSSVNPLGSFIYHCIKSTLA